ncbi:MAG: hypothetical protein WCH44_02805 [Betaproteobacteria bacterium]
MSLLHRLGLAQKFLILGVIALIMVIVPSGLYFGKSLDDIAFASRETQASTAVVALNRVLQLTQTHRGLSAGALGGNEALAALRPGMRDQVVKAMDAVDAEFKKAGASAKIMAPWSELRQRWVTLERGVSGQSLKGPQSTQLHTQLIGERLNPAAAVRGDPDALRQLSLLRQGVQVLHQASKPAA